MTIPLFQIDFTDILTKLGTGTPSISNFLRGDGSWNIPYPSYNVTIGDGTSTTFTITHNLNLANSTDCIVQVVLISDGSTVYCDVNRTTVNALTLKFINAPASNSIRVLVRG